MRSLQYIEIDVPDFEIGQNDVLLQFEGADASTTFTDESGKVWTANGNAQIDTAQFKFGASSGLFDGTGDYITTPDDASLELGGGQEFTIDFWFRCNVATGVEGGICGKAGSGFQGTPADGSFTIKKNGSNSIQVRFGYGSTIESLISSTLYTDAVNTGWHHCAIVRDNTNTDTYRLFLDGVQEDTEVVSGEINNVTSLLTIGRAGDATVYWNGHIDEFRITNGYCRWRTNFTPPTRAVGAADTTLRFAIDSGYNPADIEAIPSLTDVAFTPATVSIGEDLGQRATLSAAFKDHQHVHFADSFDSGSFWGKFRARYGNRLRGRKLRWITGLEGQSLEQMSTRHFIIDSLEGPTPRATYSIIAKDALKFVDDDRAVAPRPSTGRLNTTMTVSTTEITLTPAGIGNLEYPASGHVNIGGKEIVSFVRDVSAGNDADAILLLHFGGADASTTFTDSSSNNFTPTAVGNAQIDVAQSKFDGTSGLFDGTGDYVTFADNAVWTFSGDFTLECWARFANIAANSRCLISHGSDSNNAYRLVVSTAGALVFDVINAGVTDITVASANSLIAIDTWYHLAVTRSGNVFKLYIDGVEVATTTDSSAIPNFAGTLKIGAAGNGTNNQMNGWIDEVRISDIARWTDDFTPSSVAYQTSSDIMTIVRAQKNTEAAAHEQGERMQLVLSFAGVDPAEIIETLLIDYANVDPDYVPVSEWLTETSAFFQRVLTADIAEPTGVNKLVSEIIEQAALVVWWDDVLEKIRLQVIRPIATNVDTFDEDNTIRGSLNIIEQPASRVSQVFTYFNQLNPLKGLDNVDNFLSAALTIDLEAEDAYGRSIKTILSRWIPSGGRTTALRLNDLVLGRFKDGPRKFMLDVFRYPQASLDPVLAGGYRVESWCLQDILGQPVDAPIQITRLNPLPDRFQIEAQEMLFVDNVNDDLYDRTIIIDADQNNVNMRTLHDNLFTPPDGVTATTVTCIIESGIVVGSALPVDGVTPQVSFDVGTWPAAVTLFLIINGEIIGHGGAGGAGGLAAYGAGVAGKQGGTALYTREAISVENNGAIRGGGGGGGGAYGVENGGGGGGGGGRGVRSGRGGALGANGNPAVQALATQASLGLPEGTGLGGNDGRGDTPITGKGGTGGTYGTDGGTAEGNGGPGTGAIGGEGGVAIDGISYITMTGAGTEEGSQIN